MMDNRFAHSGSQAGHSIRQPLGNVTAMQRKISASSSPRHQSSFESFFGSLVINLSANGPLLEIRPGRDSSRFWSKKIVHWGPLRLLDHAFETGMARLACRGEPARVAGLSEHDQPSNRRRALGFHAAPAQERINFDAQPKRFKRGRLAKPQRNSAAKTRAAPGSRGRQHSGRHASALT
jgi:hypothetical protein